MNGKRVSLLLAVVAVTALLLAAAPTVAGRAATDSGGCEIAGAWVRYLDVPPGAPALFIQETLTPMDPAAKRLAYVGWTVNPDETFFGLDLEADYLSELVGEAVRTGQNTYDYSAIAYGVKKVADSRDEIRYIWVLTGSMACKDGNTKTDFTTGQVFLASQDSDGDGFPDEGEEPILCLPPHATTLARRVPLMPRCELPPP
jgi:hypothetical protein